MRLRRFRIDMTSQTDRSSETPERQSVAERVAERQGGNKITIMHVIAHIEKGGAERQLALLAENSVHRHVIVVLSGNEGPSPAKVELLSSLSPLRIFKEVRGFIRNHDVDIVQLWLPDRITIPAMLAALAEGRPIISGDRRKVRNYGMGAFRDRLPYLNHLFARVVIPNYPHLPPKLSLRRLLGIPRRTHTILNGIEYEPSVRTIATTPSRLLFVGRFVEQKRVGELIDLLPELNRNTGVAGLDIVGEGTLEADYRERARKGQVESLIEFHGRLSDWGTRFSPDRNILILPSVSEGMSNTVFEAIAQGFLPLVSRSPELEAILSDWSAKPIMFDPLDGISITDAVRQALAMSPEQIGERIRSMQASLKEFSTERMAGAYDAVYEDLFGGSAHT